MQSSRSRLWFLFLLRMLALDRKDPGKELSPDSQND